MQPAPKSGLLSSRRPSVSCVPGSSALVGVAVLTSCTRATVALARVVVKERLSMHQLVGLALALTSVALMAAG
jgi:hypothetical protein